MMKHEFEALYGHEVTGIRAKGENDMTLKEYLSKTQIKKMVYQGLIRDDDIIEVYDMFGTLVARGNWYQDNLLKWAAFYGKATQKGLHEIVFNLC